MSQEVDRRDFLKTAGVGAGAALAAGSNLLEKGGGMAEAATTPETYMSKPLIPIDLTKSPKEQALPLHNRWHPDIPPVVTVKPGAVFRVECYDWTEGQIKNDDSANDIRDVELPQVHYLSGRLPLKAQSQATFSWLTSSISAPSSCHHGDSRGFLPKPMAAGS